MLDMGGGPSRREGGGGACMSSHGHSGWEAERNPFFIYYMRYKTRLARLVALKK